MPRKSTGEYKGPPTWLDPTKELSLSQSPTFKKHEFIAQGMRALIAYGLKPRLAAEVMANACLEASWGRNCYWYNAGGWKITKAYADAYKRQNNTSPYWWKARGNTDSGDADWCFYRAFRSLEEFLIAWCEHFVPKPTETNLPYPGYREAGRKFWAGDERWFGDLILVGYKGGPSKRRMLGIRMLGMDGANHPSVRDHIYMAREVLEIWAQNLLRVDPDGAWGPKSRAAARKFQAERNLAVTGELDSATLSALAAV